MKPLDLIHLGLGEYQVILDEDPTNDRYLEVAGDPLEGWQILEANKPAANLDVEVELSLIQDAEWRFLNDPPDYGDFDHAYDAENGN